MISERFTVRPHKAILDEISRRARGSVTKENEIEPRLGGQRWARSHPDAQYLHAVIAVATRSGFVRARGRAHFKGIRLGRGTAAAAALCMPDRYPGFRSRHAVVKMKIVRFGRSSMAERKRKALRLMWRRHPLQLTPVRSK